MVATPYGLSYRAVSLWRADGSIRLRIVEGRYFESPDVRGTNRTVPAKPGQRRRNRLTDGMPIVLAGHVTGIGATLSDKRESYIALREELHPIFDATLVAPGELIETIATGGQKIALADFVSEAWDEDILGFHCIIPSIELFAAVPPYWDDVP